MKAIARWAGGIVLSLCAAACVEYDPSRGGPLEPEIDPVIVGGTTVEVQPSCAPNREVGNEGHDDGADCDHEDSGPDVFCHSVTSPDPDIYCNSCSDGTSGCYTIPGSPSDTPPPPPTPPLAPLI